MSQLSGNNHLIILDDISSQGVLKITLNDVKRRNALSEAMLNRLTTVIAAASLDMATKVVIISANGSAFSSGHDLKELAEARKASDNGYAFFSKLMSKCSHLMKVIVDSPKPIIAQIDGVATAAGCQIVASCDLAVASDESRFATPGVNIGLFCSTPMVALSRNVSRKHAMEMLLTGDMVTAEDAQKIGLINKVANAARLSDITMDLAIKIASKSSHTIAIGKTAFYRQAEMSISEAYDYASEVMVKNMMHSVSDEGISAFLEKRTPHWEE